jgi:hypothetical protein
MSHSQIVLAQGALYFKADAKKANERWKAMGEIRGLPTEDVSVFGRDFEPPKTDVSQSFHFTEDNDALRRMVEAIVSIQGEQVRRGMVASSLTRLDVQNGVKATARSQLAALIPPGTSQEFTAPAPDSASKVSTSNMLLRSHRFWLLRSPPFLGEPSLTSK